MALPDELAADHLELEAELGLTLLWNGGTYPCLTGSSHRRKRNTSGGYTLEADKIFSIRAALFSTADLAILKAGTKNTLTHDGYTWRIDEAITPAGDPWVKLLCNDPAQGL